MVAAIGPLDRENKLVEALVTDIGIHRIIVIAGEGEVLAVDPAAEPFDGVVGAVVDLNILEEGTATNAA